MGEKTPQPEIKQSPSEIALQLVLSGEKETVCFPIGELEPADLTECTLEPLKDHEGIFAIVSHEQTGAVGFTKNQDVLDVKSGFLESFADHYYE